MARALANSTLVLRVDETLLPSSPSSGTRMRGQARLAVVCCAGGIMFGSNRSRSPLTACMAATLAVFSVASHRVSAAETQAPQAPAQAAPAAQVVGAIKTISGTTLTLAPDKGGEVSVAVQPGARIVRVAPGQTDLKGAAALQLSDLQVGDRILVRGKASDDGKSIAAVGIIAMKLSDVEAKKKADHVDWQKRGVGGLVSAVDAASGAI